MIMKSIFFTSDTSYLSGASVLVYTAYVVCDSAYDVKKSS